MIARLTAKVRELRTDTHMREIGRGALIALILKVGGSGLAFAFNVAVARLLGAQGAGIYFLALSITNVSSVIGRVGLDTALLRFVAVRAAQKDWKGVKGIYNLGIRMTIIASGFIAIIVFTAATWIATTIFNRPELAEPLRWMSLSILPFSLLNIQAESLKGLKLIRDAMIVQNIGMPLIGMLLIIPMAHAAGVLGVSITYVVSAIMVALFATWLWTRAVSDYAVKAAPFPFKEIWTSCRPLLGISILDGAVLPSLPFFLLGIWSSSTEVGIFGATVRVAMLVSFFLVAVSSVVAPKFASLYAKGDMHGLGQMGRHASLLLTLLAAPVVLVMIFAGDWVMGLYGKAFTAGSTTLAILAFGELVNAMCGPVGFLLIMCGHERALRKGTIISLVFQLILCLILIPRFGMEGAGIAMAAGVIINNLIAVFYVRKLIRIAYPIKLGWSAV